ncbi:AfsA-related hotdog domain-containing protein [Streptomyces sp. NBC_01006]|uniref:AfsA-related hotdog domain-containing protein n=1 Tax=Streptomyces sp. NBC_01006 TaxID=2903716 RepID=UPI00386803BD|nr:hypothetical protein OG509_25595 [Streptomyces sp. NBC_01006]
MSVPMPHESSQATDAKPGTLFLVGDVFAEFAHHEGVFTVSQLARLIRNGTFPDGPDSAVDADADADADGVRVSVGQGVSLFDVQFIRDTLARRGLADLVVIDDQALHTRAGREIAHKHRPENVLISAPRPVGADWYEADLLVDGDNEVMSDHLTGQHMQGMLATEAGRQMFIAVAEQFYLPPEAVGSSYFVIDSFATRYRNFLFPLPAVVRCRVLAHRTPHRTRMTFHCELSVSQGGSETAGMEVRFTAFDTQVSHAKETRAAQRSLQDGVALAAAAAAAEAAAPARAEVRTS